MSLETSLLFSRIYLENEGWARAGQTATSLAE